MRGSRPPAPGLGGPALGGPAPAAHALSADPFAAAPVAPAQEVRLIIDDKAVSDDEVGRKAGSKLIIGLVAAAVLGIGIGWMIGSTVRERSMFNLALQDAKDIYGTTSTAAPTVEKVQKLLDQAVRAAAGASPTIDAKALEELRKLEKPFPADAFARKFYRAFEPATVDSLFTYYNNVNLLWAKLQSLAGRGLNPNTRAQLEGAAKAAGLEYGCVPFSEGDKPWGCGLVTLTSIEEAKAKVTLRGQSYEKTVFAGQDVKGKASDFVIPVDRVRSGEVLGGTTSLFQSYARDLIEAKTLADQTTEIQGRLIQQLGAIAKLESL
jgi:hypothetical protein